MPRLLPSAMTWSVRCLLVAGLIAGGAALPAREASAASPVAESLLPATTRLFVAIRNIKSFEDAAKQTKFGGIFKDESLKPFIDDVEAQIDARIQESNQSLGISIRDFRGLSEGELAVAVVDLGEGQTGTVVTVDVTGKDKELASVRGKITTALAQKNATPSPYASQAGAQGTKYDIPPIKEGGRPLIMVEAAHKTADGVVWIVSDNPAVTEIVSGALAGGSPPDTLAKLATFQKVIDGTKPDTAAGEPTAHLAVFVDPLGLAAALRAYEYPPKVVKPDPLEVFKNAGFDAIKAIGGQAVVHVGDYGALVRAAVIAPKPHEKSMQMLTFLTGPNFMPQPWVAADVTSYATLYHDVLKAFDNFGPLFDGFLEDEGLWQEVVESIRTDEDGPKIDLRKDLFALLGQRVSFIVDKTRPIDANSGKQVIAVEIQPGADAKLAESIRKMFDNDPTVTKVKVVGPEGEIDGWRIEATEEVPPEQANQDGVVDGMRVVASVIVIVHGGHLFIGSDEEALKKVLAKPTGPGLAAAPDYVAVADKLGSFIVKMGPTPKVQAIGFNRLDEMLELDYELARSGKLKGAKTVLGQIVEGVDRKAESEGKDIKIDGSKLPPFENVRKYLSPTGAVIVETPDGLFGVGFSLEKIPAPAAK